MAREKEMSVLYSVVFCMIILCWHSTKGQQLICENRNPEGYTVSKAVGDGGFKITVTGSEGIPALSAMKGRYVPNEVYTVKIQGLKNRYSTQKFTEFLLVAESEKQAMMGQSGLMTTGIFHIMDDSQSRFSDFCPDGVTSSNLSPKSEISVLWTAPSVLVSSCITFKVTLVERPHIWYMDDGQLTKTLCPEMPSAPKAQDVLDNNDPSSSPFHEPQGASDSYRDERLPIVTPESTEDKCCACDDAKYEVIFEGLWSKETHPRDFPENEWLLHFSDIIGASHSKNYYFWEVGKEASEGIRQVAEWGATRHLENELKSKSKFINTIIKARGLWHPNEKGKTSAAFRVDKNHHLMSLVSMIGPSPDWIVGISGFELCQKNCTWLDEAHFDLYPYDAGVDSGISYMSPNSPSNPRERIHRITPTEPDDPRSPFHNLPGGVMSPFARVLIRRQRIYPKTCDQSSQAQETSHEIVIAENTEEANRPECAVSDWTTWSDCSVACGKGLRMRKRAYLNPMKATMMECDRQLIEKEMCLGEVPTCDNEGDGIEEIDSICAVSDWSEWTPCSVTCGKGTHRRTRAYRNHLGRKKCNLETVQSKSCVGAKEECDPVADTNELQADPDCALTPWSDWTPCSVTCGRGFRERSRRFLLANEEPVPNKCKALRLQTTQKNSCVGDNGLDCAIGMSEAKEICMLPAETGPCRANHHRFAFSIEKGMCVPFSYGGCKGNRNRFASESDCIKVCGFLGGGQQSPETDTDTVLPLSREVTPRPSRRQASSVQDPVPTLPQAIDNPVIEPENIEESIPPKVDCSVSDWSAWSPCSVTCGVGHIIRTRVILAQPQNDGKRCPRRIKKRKICRMNPC